MRWVTGAKHSTWWTLLEECSRWRCFSLMGAGFLAIVQSCVERPRPHGGHAFPSASPLNLRQPSVTESQIMKSWSKRHGIPQGLAEQLKKDKGWRGVKICTKKRGRKEWIWRRQGSCLNYSEADKTDWPTGLLWAINWNQSLLIYGLLDFSWFKFYFICQDNPKY